MAGHKLTLYLRRRRRWAVEPWHYRDPGYYAASLAGGHSGASTSGLPRGEEAPSYWSRSCGPDS